MEFLFLCYPKCSTCRKARQWLDGHGIAYQERNIAEEPPGKEELFRWISGSGLDSGRFFNKSGLIYKSLGLKDRLDQMPVEERIRLLAANGMLVKRPLLIGAGAVLVGFHQKQWEEALLSSIAR